MNNPETLEQMRTRNTEEEAARANAPEEVPKSVDAWKLKAVLEIAGKTPIINMVIDGIDDDTQRIAIRAGWDNAPVIHRDNAFVKVMSAISALEISKEQMDAFFLATKQFD